MNPSDHSSSRTPRPYAMLGAGQLMSTLQKQGDVRSGWQYRFNLFRLEPNGSVHQWLGPGDLVDLVKLVRVLATELTEDGCLSARDQVELGNLVEALDSLFELGN